MVRRGVAHSRLDLAEVEAALRVVLAEQRQVGAVDHSAEGPVCLQPPLEGLEVLRFALLRGRFELQGSGRRALRQVVRAGRRIATMMRSQPALGGLAVSSSLVWCPQVGSKSDAAAMADAAASTWAGTHHVRCHVVPIWVQNTCSTSRSTLRSSQRWRHIRSRHAAHAGIPAARCCDYGGEVML